MKKKNVLASLLLAGAMFLTACGGSASSTSAAGGVSGSFTGTAKGFGGDVSVTLTLTDNVITDCTAKGDEETPGIGSVVIEQFPGEVVEGNTINLDSISGATITSNALTTAVNGGLYYFQTKLGGVSYEAK